MSDVHATPAQEPLSWAAAGALQVDYNGGTNPIYLGFASPGTPTATSRWQIRKLTFDGNNNVTGWTFPNGDYNLAYVWDNRASYSYS